MSAKPGNSQRKSGVKTSDSLSFGKKPRPKKAARSRTPGGQSGQTGHVIAFRPRLIEDDDYILQLTESQLAAVHQQAFGEPFPREQFLRYLQSGAPTVIVEKDKKRIGYYSYLVSHDGKMHVSAMVIDPAHQSDGIGTGVMKRLEQDAQAIGVHTLEVYVQENNARSLAFTRKLGFVEVYRVTPDTICFQKQVLTGLGQSVNQAHVGLRQGPYIFG